MRKTHVILFTLIAIFAFGVTALAQDDAKSAGDLMALEAMVPDPGIADTGIVISASYATVPTQFVVDFEYFCDEGFISFSTPILWDNPDIIPDSVSYVGSPVENWSWKPVSIDTLGQSLLAGGLGFGTPVGPGRLALFKIYFTVDPSVTSGCVNFTAGDIGDYVYTTVDGQGFNPQFVSGQIELGEGGCAAPEPTIDLSAASFTFEANEGGSNPADQYLTVNNSGDGTLAWTASNNESWLTIAPASGSDGDAITLSVNITGLTPGSYTDYVTVSDPAATNDPQTAEVTLTVLEVPEITVSTTSLQFEAIEGESNPANQDVTITNTGGGTLAWTVSNNESWLTINPTSGGTGATVTFSVDISGLSTGMYTDAATFTDANASNSPQTVNIVLYVNEPPPTINTDVTSVGFSAEEGGANPSDGGIYVTNTGGGTLAWSAYNDESWLTINPTSGGDGDMITLSVDISGLTAGTYTDAVTIYDGNATNSPVKVNVNLDVTVSTTPGHIVLSESSFEFLATEGGGNPVTQSLTVTNSGDIALDFTASNSESWLTLSPTTGTDGTSITLTVDITGLTAGTYTDEIVITDDMTDNSPQTASVSLTVAGAAPIIALDPTTVDVNGIVGEAISDATVAITNNGGGTLAWTASNSESWLTIDPTSGSGGGTLTLSFDSNQPAGVYNDVITVTDAEASNSPQTVNVSMTLIDPPCLALSANELNFSGLIGESFNQTIDISNCGDADLVWMISGNDASWLTINPTSGTNAATVTFTVDLTGLAAGSYQEVITVSGAEGTTDSPQDITVNLTVREEFNFSSQTGTNPTDQLLDISNYGEGSFYWSAMLAKGTWLSINPTTGTETDDIILSVDITGLAAGDYVDTVFISVDEAKNYPVFAVINLTVSEEPCFSFPTNTIAFTGDVGEAIPSVNLQVTNPCGGTLEWTLNWKVAWLTVSPTSGGADQMVNFAVNTTGMGAGSYIDTVFFASNGIYEADTVVVLLQLESTEEPVLSVSPVEFNFGNICLGSDLGSSFNITNAGTGTLDWTLTDVAEIDFSATGGTAPSAVDFSINTGGLSLGYHEFTTTVTADGAEGSPQTVTFTMTIIDCGACSFDIANVEAQYGIDMMIGVPIYAYGEIADLAGGQFHIAFDPSVITPASTPVKSDYITDYTVGMTDGAIHYIWTAVGSEFTVPQGGIIATLWFNVVGNVGDVSLVNWMDPFELVQMVSPDNPQELYDLLACDGEVAIVQPLADVYGHVVYYDMIQGVPDVTIDLDEMEMPKILQSTTTDGAGDYAFYDIAPNNWTLTASRTEHDGGVNILDAIKIERHLAFLNTFANPYQMIAADVDVSHSVMVMDVVYIRLYLAKLEGDLPGGNWKFINSGYPIEMSNWYAFSNQIGFSINGVDVTAPDFIGVRLGDVDETWNISKMALKSGFNLPEAYLTLNDLEVTPGETFTVPVYLSDVDVMAGIELHLGYNSDYLKVKAIDSDLLTGAYVNNTDNAIHVVWSDINNTVSASGETAVIEVTFEASQYFTGTTEITVDDVVIGDYEGNGYPVETEGAVLMSNGSGSLPNAYALYQNSPNPFNPETTIKAVMQEAGQYSLTIFAINGEKIREYRDYSAAGEISIRWDGHNDNGEQVASGIYLYRFQAGNFSETKKMVLLK